jgi:thiamine-monophosphate kinase
MFMMSDILENALIDSLTAGFERSPLQVNAIHCADAEIVRLPSTGGGAMLAMTTDTLVEEIASGLYSDPYLIGWMSVIASMSDLAATGASPLGILVSEVLPQEFSRDDLSRLQAGIHDACVSCNTFVLGGDTNSGSSLQMTGCAIGILKQKNALTRIGCAPGEVIYASGLLGEGNAFAAAKLFGGTELPFRPLARLAEGQLLCGLATACMDSSDGAIATLDQLMRLNGVGVRFSRPLCEVLTPSARIASQSLAVPPWSLLAGIHGEFELIFSLPPAREEELHARAATIGWTPVPLGETTAEPIMTIPMEGADCAIDSGFLRNLGTTGARDVAGYVQALKAYDAMLNERMVEYGH